MRSPSVPTACVINGKEAGCWIHADAQIVAAGGEVTCSSGNDGTQDVTRALYSLSPGDVEKLHFALQQDSAPAAPGTPAGGRPPAAPQPPPPQHAEV